MRPTLALPLALLLAACGATSDATTDAGDTTTASATTDAPDSSSGPTTAAASDTGDDTSTGSTAAPTTAPDPTTTTDDPGDTTAATALTTGDDTGAPVEELPPIDSVEILEAWLAGGAYKQWAVESQVHASTGPHGGNVRTYVNAIALASLMAQNSEHPQDAATVKELYGAGVDTLIGYAVSLKTAPTSEGGTTWYWYERVNGTTYGGDLGVGLCTGCHGGGADYILTPFPLQ